jgi:tRNA pseudouridine32 synthase/23S rRNA pseudouridine746 synthase
MSCFKRFRTPIDHLSLPERFTFPFYYEPHPLSLLAAKELQEYLEHQTDWKHLFWPEQGNNDEVYGKMFGVLVVQNHHGELGYLTAFSGKVAGSYRQPGFVPPVFDLLAADGFYKKEEQELKQLNQQILELEQSSTLKALEQLLDEATKEASKQIEFEKENVRTTKSTRQQRRTLAQENLTPAAMQDLETHLAAESLKEHYALKDLKKSWKKRLEVMQVQLKDFTNEIEAFKEERKLKSMALQQKIISEYVFLNQSGVKKSLAEIFHGDAVNPPPGGAGECAAPKLLQYAYLHQLKPIAMAEFWWGVSPAGEIRKHGDFYPACRGKCLPILSHMLEGLAVDDDPLLSNAATAPQVNILFEDDSLAILHKPAGMLSVPGRNDIESVYSLMRKKYPRATGPLIVHRLDRATSGLMMIAKTTAVYKKLQRQFLFHQVEKRYVALLDGVIEDETGTIDLPLRVDLDDRPRQLVCYEHGKKAVTQWQVIERLKGQTRIHFFPLTGRTHQLRVHAAHQQGLNTPIVGDDIYGHKSDRLYLQAAAIAFDHPVSGEKLIFQVTPEF